MKVIKKIVLFFFFLIVSSTVFAGEPDYLWIFRKAYPNATFTCRYDSSVGDYLVTIKCDGRTSNLYWQGSRLIPKSEIKNASLYHPLLYEYEDEIKEPEKLTAKEVAQINAYASTENRKNGPGTPPFFYDVIYDCETRVALEKHIARVTFLGKRTNVHEKIINPLKKVDEKLKAMSSTDKEVKQFLENLDSADSYNWRSVADSRKRSFHSLAIALDVLPLGWKNKNMYWLWRKEKDPNWMKLPKKDRWMPPEIVIKIFEDEGFIYGGKWTLWDNMHFEYHPEVIFYTQRIHQEAEERAAAEAKRLAEEKARREAEAKALKEAEEKARREAEAKALKEAEEKARREAEEQALREAEEKARKEAEEELKESQPSEPDIPEEESPDSEQKAEVPEILEITAEEKEISEAENEETKSEEIESEAKSGDRETSVPENEEMKSGSLEPVETIEFDELKSAEIESDAKSGDRETSGAETDELKADSLESVETTETGETVEEKSVGLPEN